MSSCSGTGIEKGRICIIIFMNIYYITGYAATNIIPYSSIQFLGYKNMDVDTKLLLYLYYKPRYSHIYNDATAILKNCRHG